MKYPTKILSMLVIGSFLLLTVESIAETPNRTDIARLYCRETAEHPGMPYMVFQLVRNEVGEYGAGLALDGSTEEPKLFLSKLKCEFGREEPAIFLCHGPDLTIIQSIKIVTTKFRAMGFIPQIMPASLTIAMLGPQIEGTYKEIHFPFFSNCQAD